MKIARFFAVIFGLIGTILMAGTLVLCLTSLQQPVKLTELPAEAGECAKNMMEALAEGDYAAAAGSMYGQPDLGAGREPADEAGRLVWNAFLDSVSYEFTSECYVRDSGIYRDARITTLDIPSVTEKLQVRAHALLTAKVEAAEDMAELYGEDGNFREDLVAEVLRQALNEALAEDTRTVTRDVTLNLIRQDGQWWVVPDQALLQAICGGVA